MTHSICTPEAGGGLAYLQRLWRTLLAPPIDPKISLEQLFEHETVDFGLEYAFLSHIDLENETEGFEVVRGSHEVLELGNTVSLTKTYCRKTIADPEGTLAVSDALAEGWKNDKAYETFEFGSYLGTTVSGDHGLYGTLCFANTAPREEPIRDEEKALIELHAQWVEYILEFWDGPPIRGTRTDTIEGRAVSSEAIDTMMGTLKSHSQRVILMTLVGETTETTLATLEQQIDDKNARIKLHHFYLPKLANAGYITWNDDEDTISKGPKFSEVEPLVELLKEYNTAFTE